MVPTVSTVVAFCNVQNEKVKIHSALTTESTVFKMRSINLYKVLRLYKHYKQSYFLF